MADVPVDLDRDAARDAATRELSDPGYAEAGPNALERGFGWVVEQLGKLLAGIGGGLPWQGGVAILLAIVLIIVLIVRYWRGRAVRNVVSVRNVFGGRTMSADEHRRAAEEAQRRGDLTEAVRERFRALVRELEQRGVLVPRAGRTVDEVATEAGRALPALADDLRGAAWTFDDVFYGGRPATTERYEQLVTVDDRVRA